MKKNKLMVCFDVETTGLDKSKDFIIQWAGVKFNPSTGEIVDSKKFYIQPEGSYSISIQAYMKHHISPDFLKDKPYFFEVVDEILEFISDCDILSYNGNGFDIPMFKEELKRVHRDYNFLEVDCYDAFLEEKRRNGLSLDNTYKRYTKHTMEEDGLLAHDALSDVKGTIAIFLAQQKKKKYGPEVMYGEDQFITNSMFNGKEVPCFNVGKYKTLPISYIANIDQGYLNWCVGENSSFSASTKEYIRQYIH